MVARCFNNANGPNAASPGRTPLPFASRTKRDEYHDASPEATITRQQFDGWTQHILNRVDLPIRRVLGDAKLSKDDVDEVILVGGATRMPAVIDRVTQLLGKPPHRRLNPDQVVALGAAVQAGLIVRDQSVEDLVVTDVAPFTLGIMIAKHFGHESAAATLCQSFTAIAPFPPAASNAW